MFQRTLWYTNCAHPNLRPQENRGSLLLAVEFKRQEPNRKENGPRGRSGTDWFYGRKGRGVSKHWGPTPPGVILAFPSKPPFWGGPPSLRRNKTHADRILLSCPCSDPLTVTHFLGAMDTQALNPTNLKTQGGGWGQVIIREPEMVDI